MPSEEVKKFVDAKIQGKKVMVFSKSYCPYCKRAKDVLKKYLGKDLAEEDYEVLEIEDRGDCDGIQDYSEEHHWSKIRKCTWLFTLSFLHTDQSFDLLWGGGGTQNIAYCGHGMNLSISVYQCSSKLMMQLIAGHRLYLKKN